MRKLHVAVIALALAVVLALSATANAAIFQARTAVLSGAAEVPGPGDPDGSGVAFVFFRPNPAGLICWNISVSGIGPVVAAHIHAGAAGTAGPIVVDFSGQLSGCTKAGPILATAILAHSSDYYVNVHTAEFPAGAVRGQLIPAVL
jgi:hypothetical protein